MALGYLISPVIQVEDVNGKPLVGGRIRVYEAGTTNPYITYKDWMGDRNPAEVILDAKGMCVLIADDTKTYDIYCEDRERVEQWSRLNVNVGQGGGGASGITNITSHDGSITVVRSGSTVDITLNDGEPSAIIARSRELDADGHFIFVGPPANIVGDDLGIGDGYVRGNARWYHYDAMVRIDWQTPQNASRTISITGPDSVETVEFDLTFGHTEWITLAADYQVVNDNDALAFGISGMPEGMTAEIVSLSVHNIVALDSEDHGEQYSAGNGITIQSGVIAIDPAVVQEKLEAGANISIVGNVISATAEPQQPADWAATEGVTRILNKPDLGVYATHSELTYGLAQKQDTISDLATIRSGAAAGATAVQPAEMTSALAGKQDVISDLSTIRSGAAKGATSVQPADLAPYAVASDVETALAGKQDTISDLSTIRSGASAGATAVQPATMNSALAGKQDTISDLATIRSGAASGATAVQPSTMNTALAGKQDVISDLSDIRSGAAAGATAVQPADMNTALAGKQDVISDLATIRSGAAAGATAVQSGDLATVATTGAYSDLSGTPTIPVVDQTYDASSANAQSGVAVASAISGKQDTISDLSTIRSGAAAGATAVQPGDLATVATTGAYSDLSGTPTIPTVDQTYSAASTNAQSGVAVAQAVAGVNAVPASTSSDADKVLTVDAQGVPGWANAQAPISAGNGVDITNNVVSAKVDGTSISFNAQGQLQSSAGTQADWAETDPADPSYIVAKPVPKTLAAGNGISITENQSTITITNTSTVDQTYDASSANAQSGVAVASGIASAISAAVIPISVVAALPANPDPNTLYVVTGA